MDERITRARHVEDGERPERLGGPLAALAAGVGSTELDDTAVCRVLARVAAAALGDAAVVRLVQDSTHTLTPVAVDGADPEVTRAVRRLMTTLPVSTDSANPYAEALRTGRERAISGAELVAMRRTLPPQLQAVFDELGVTAIHVVPLRAFGRALGTLGLWRYGSRPPHGPAEQALMQDLGDCAAPAIYAAQAGADLARERSRRRRAEESLRSTSEIVYRLHEGRKALAESVLEAQEQERRRIAADVHDDSIQAMSTISLRLQLLRRRVTEPGLCEAVDDLEDIVDEAIARLRVLLLQLDPDLLDTVGLAEAIRTFCRQTLRPAGIVFLVRSGLRTDPAGEARLLLYRIAQEALTNVRRHADADHVMVSFDVEDDSWTVSIRDDGRGFNVHDVMSRELPGVPGLRGMHERAALAGGGLEIISAPGEGTEVRARVPVEPADVDTVGRPHSR